MTRPLFILALSSLTLACKADTAPSEDTGESTEDTGESTEDTGEIIDDVQSAPGPSLDLHCHGLIDDHLAWWMELYVDGSFEDSRERGPRSAGWSFLLVLCAADDRRGTALLFGLGPNPAPLRSNNAAEVLAALDGVIRPERFLRHLHTLQSSLQWSL